RSYLSKEVGVEEKGKGESVAPGSILYAMRSAAKIAARHLFQHVANVADIGIGNRRCVDPAGSGLYLQAAGIILLEDGEHSVVRVLTNAPLLNASVRRIVEDAE